MEKELAHSFNIRLSKEVAQKLREEQKKLTEEFNELRFYDPSPHLAIATKFMSESKTEEFIEALKREFKNDRTWELEFADFSLSESGDYIFLNLSPESRQYIFDLHKRALRVTENIGFKNPDGAETPKYQYNPHLSIIKLQLKEVIKAVSLIKKDFSGMKMPVSHYEVTRQQEDEKGFSNFPVICGIDLK